MQQFLTYFPLCLAALAAGIVNSLAGGGTLLTFPALKSGLEPQFGPLADAMANGTSTVALAPASFSSAWAFRKELAKVRRWLALLILPSLVGGGLGSLLVIQNPEQFKALVPWLILTAATLFAVQPVLTRWVTSGDPTAHANPSRWAVVGMIGAQFLIAVYGGYFGAGIGILMLSGLGLMGMKDIHEMNALKTVLAGCINGVAVIVFVATGNFEPTRAFFMMAAAILGGYLGARFGRQLKQKYIRWFVIAVGFGLASYYFWLQFAHKPEPPARKMRPVPSLALRVNAPHFSCHLSSHA